MFQYDTKLLEQFPNTVGGIILARNMSNAPSSDVLQELYIAEQKAVIEKIGDTPLSQLDSLSAWRSIFSAFGVNPTKTRSAAEALLRRLTKKAIFRLLIRSSILVISSAFVMEYLRRSSIPAI